MKVLALLLVLLTTGCLHSEEIDVRILREKGDPSVMVMEQANFYSSETDPEKMRQDFDQLIRNWRSEESLAEGAADGFQIKGRELFLRDGKIVLRTTGILQTLAFTDEVQISESSITLTVKEDIVETNGRISDTDLKKIIWPKDASELHVKLREELRESYKASQPQMVQLMQLYLAAREK